MPTPYSDLVILTTYYLVFLMQIYFLSIHYPSRIRQRALHILDNYTPAKYPKLYPHPIDNYAEAIAKSRWVSFKIVNYLIAGAGLLIIFAMAISGYEPDPKGGDESLVLAYFVLQIIPILYISYKELKLFGLMRKESLESTRRANLNPRRLFDFISPVYVIIAVLLFIAYVVFYYYTDIYGSEHPWNFQTCATYITITATNLLWITVILKYLHGKKINPYQNPRDRLMEIEVVIKVCILSSILMSIFLIVSSALDKFSLEILDPPIASLNFQLCVFLGMGLVLHKIKLEAIDFEVYRTGNSGSVD